MSWDGAKFCSRFQDSCILVRTDNNATGGSSMVSEHEMSSRSHAYDFTSATLTAEDVSFGGLQAWTVSCLVADEWWEKIVCLLTWMVSKTLILCQSWSVTGLYSASSSLKNFNLMEYSAVNPGRYSVSWSLIIAGFLHVINPIFAHEEAKRCHVHIP